MQMRPRAARKGASSGDGGGAGGGEQWRDHVGTDGFDLYMDGINGGARELDRLAEEADIAGRAERTRGLGHHESALASLRRAGLHGQDWDTGRLAHGPHLRTARTWLVSGQARGGANYGGGSGAGGGGGQAGCVYPSGDYHGGTHGSGTGIGLSTVAAYLLRLSGWPSWVNGVTMVILLVLPSAWAVRVARGRSDAGPIAARRRRRRRNIQTRGGLASVKTLRHADGGAGTVGRRRGIRDRTCTGGRCVAWRARWVGAARRAAPRRRTARKRELASGWRLCVDDRSGWQGRDEEAAPGTDHAQLCQQHAKPSGDRGAQRRRDSRGISRPRTARAHGGREYLFLILALMTIVGVDKQTTELARRGGYTCGEEPFEHGGHSGDLVAVWASGTAL